MIVLVVGDKRRQRIRDVVAGIHVSFRLFFLFCRTIFAFIVEVLVVEILRPVAHFVEVLLRR